MWLESLFGLAVFYFGFMYLKQITTWTFPAFRQGIVVRKYEEQFSGQIPKELLKQEIICDNIIFKFDSPTSGLFRAHPKIAFLKNRRKSYFPSLLGEINISRSGIAEITLRAPLSLTLIWLAVFVAVVALNLESIPIISSAVGITKCGIVLLVFGVFAFINYDLEKADLYEGVNLLNERANSKAL